MIPDPEKVIAAYLRDETEARVVAKTPDSLATPWVRLTVLGGPQEEGSVVDRNVAAYVQCDCYAGATGGQPEASELARSVRAAIAEIDEYEHEGAIVTAGRINGYSRIPDSDLEPARERFIVTATVSMH